jgi:hypothetical protein
MTLLRFVIRLVQSVVAVLSTGLASARLTVTQVVKSYGLPPQPEPAVPYKIANSPYHVPTGPNLIADGSFESGNFAAEPETETIVAGSGVITSWLVLQDGGAARWIDAAHPIFTNAAEGNRFVDLTGGALPGPARILATLYRDSGLSLQAGKSYEIALAIGVGPDNGASGNFGPPVSVRVAVIRAPYALSELFVSNPAVLPQGTGVSWERCAFRFRIPAAYAFAPGSQTISITGVNGNRFIGVDDVSVSVLT